MSSEGNIHVSLVRMGLNRWITTQSLCHKKEDSLETSDIRLSSVYRNCCAESCVAP